jgi:hypothetical protein
MAFKSYQFVSLRPTRGKRAVSMAPVGITATMARWCRDSLTWATLSLMLIVREREREKLRMIHEEGEEGLSGWRVWKLPQLTPIN